MRVDDVRTDLWPGNDVTHPLRHLNGENCEEEEQDRFFLTPAVVPLDPARFSTWVETKSVKMTVKSFWDY